MQLTQGHVQFMLYLQFMQFHHRKLTSYSYIASCAITALELETLAVVWAVTECSCQNVGDVAVRLHTHIGKHR